MSPTSKKQNKKDKGKKLLSKKQPKKSSAKTQSDSDDDARIRMSDTDRAKVFAEIREKKKILFGDLEGMSDGLVKRRVAWKEILAFCKALGYDYGESYKTVQTSWNRAKRKVHQAWKKSQKTGGGGDAAFLKQLKSYEKVVYNAIKEDVVHMSKLKVISNLLQSFQLSYATDSIHHIS